MMEKPACYVERIHRSERAILPAGARALTVWALKSGPGTCRVNPYNWFRNQADGRLPRILVIIRLVGMGPYVGLQQEDFVAGAYENAIT